MTTMSNTTIRIDKKKRSQVDAALKELGLTFNAYVNLAVNQLLIQKKIPFEIKLPSPIPNDTTEKALEIALEKQNGVRKEDTPAFTNAEEMIKYMKNYHA